MVEPVNIAQLPSTRSSAYRDIYANFVTGRLGPYDLTLTFIQTKTAGPDPNTLAMGLDTHLISEEQVAITMSPVQFKLLANLCNRLTAAYEQTMAPIHLPAHDQTPRYSVEDIVAQIQQSMGQAAAKAETSSEPLQQPTRRPGARKKKGT